MESEPDGISPREEAGNELVTPVGRGFAPHGRRELVADGERPLAAQRIGLPITLATAKQRPVFPPLLTLEVAVKQPIHLLPRQPAFPLDALFQRGERIGHHGQSGAVNRKVVIFRAAVRNVTALLDRAVAQQVQQQLRLIEFLIFQVMADSLGRRPHRFPKMRRERTPQPLRSPHGISLRLAVSHFENFGQIHLHQVVHRILQSRQRHPVAPHGDTPARQLFIKSIAHESGHQRLIARKARPTVTVLHQTLDAVAQQLRIKTIMHADRDIERRIDLAGRIQNQERNCRSLVFSVGIGASQLPIDRIVYQQTSQIVDRLGVGDASRRDVPLVKRP